MVQGGCGTEPSRGARAVRHSTGTGTGRGTAAWGRRCQVWAHRGPPGQTGMPASCGPHLGRHHPIGKALLGGGCLPALRSLGTPMSRCQGQNASACPAPRAPQHPAECPLPHTGLCQHTCPWGWQGRGQATRGQATTRQQQQPGCAPLGTQCTRAPQEHRPCRISLAGGEVSPCPWQGEVKHSCQGCAGACRRAGHVPGSVLLLSIALPGREAGAGDVLPQASPG